MKKIILITGSELRHDYFRLKISSSENIDVIRTYCESKKNSIENKIKSEQNKILRETHLNNRKKSEIIFLEGVGYGNWKEKGWTYGKDVEETIIYCEIEKGVKLD